MRRFMMIVMLCSALSAPAFAAPASKDSVLANLRAREPRPMTADDWRKLGDGVEALLDEAFHDRALLVAHRARALGALAKMGGPRADRTLSEVLGDRKAQPALVAVAVEAYAAYFGAQHPAVALTYGKSLLAHKDWLVRQAAARALGRLATADAKAALAARKPKERHGAVKAAIDAALK